MTEPDPESLQVTLLGRGVGECVVVHLPGGDWLVVDSFNHRGRAVGLHHLEACGVPADRVVALVVTHFHADHYRKIDDLHDGCLNAKLYITEALERERFKSLFLATSEPAVFEALPATVGRARERDFDEPGASGLVTLKSNTLVSNPRRNHTVLALSPSDIAVDQSNEDLAAWIGTDVDPAAIRAHLRDDNRCSIVLHIDVGFTTVLLGADLEREPHDAGWPAVHAAHNNLTPASILKIPHHGSETAEHPAVWEMTKDGAELVVSPYWSSGIPTPEDVARLAKHGRLWQTLPATKAEAHLLGDQPPPKEPLGWVTATRGPADEQWSVTPGGTAFEAGAAR